MKNKYIISFLVVLCGLTISLVEARGGKSGSGRSSGRGHGRARGDRGRGYGRGGYGYNNGGGWGGYYSDYGVTEPLAVDVGLAIEENEGPGYESQNRVGNRNQRYGRGRRSHSQQRSTNRSSRSTSKRSK